MAAPGPPLGGAFVVYGAPVAIPKGPAMLPSIPDKTETVSGRTWRPRGHTPVRAWVARIGLSTAQKQKGFWTKAVKYFAMGMNSDRSEGEFSSIVASHFVVFDYLITLSARTSTFGGIVRPICFAVLRLITNSNFVGCSTGRSAGLAPFRILST